MNPLIDRRVFFKIAATGVAGYFVSPDGDVCSDHRYVRTLPTTILSTARTASLYCCRARRARSTRSICASDHGLRRTLRPTRSTASIGRPACCRHLADQFGLSRFSIIRSCQSTALVHNLLQNWTQIARNPTSATGKIAPNMGSVVALEMEPSAQRESETAGLLSLEWRREPRGRRLFFGQVCAFRCNAGGRRSGESDESGRSGGCSPPATTCCRPRTRDACDCLHRTERSSTRWRTSTRRRAT